MQSKEEFIEKILARAKANRQNRRGIPVNLPPIPTVKQLAEEIETLKEVDEEE